MSLCDNDVIYYAFKTTQVISTQDVFVLQTKKILYSLIPISIDMSK